MKVCECYRKALIAVANSSVLTGEEKIEVLRVLLKDEELALFIEKQQEKGGLNNVCSR